ncbi:MAG: site-specific integrase [Acutalibacteraceae bacterium]
MERILTQRNIEQFYTWLKTEEKSRNTIEKYIRDVTAFESFLAGAEVMKETVIAYKNKLISENYAVRSINSMLASVNSLLAFLGWTE